MKNIFLGFGLLLSMISCNPTQMLNPNSEDLNFHIVYESEFGGSGQNELTIIHDSKEYDELIAHFGLEEIADFDGTKQTVAVQNFDSQRTGGSEYKVLSVERKDGKIKIFYSIQSPDTYALNAITSPVLIVILEEPQLSQIEFIQQK